MFSPFSARTGHRNVVEALFAARSKPMRDAVDLGPRSEMIFLPSPADGSRKKKTSGVERVECTDGQFSSSSDPLVGQIRVHHLRVNARKFLYA